MRVIFNSLSAFRPRTGVGAYVAQLLAELRESAGEHDVTAFPDGWLAETAKLAGSFLALRQRRGTSLVEAPGGTVESWRRALLRLSRAGLQEFFRRGFRSSCRRGRFDLYHEPNFIAWPSDVPTVVTIHDLSALLYPHWHPPDRARYHERNFHRSLTQCHHIITDTENIRSELVQATGVALARVTAIPIGVGAQMRPLTRDQQRPVLERLGLPDDYLLYVGTIEPRKNILTLLHAYCTLPDTVRTRCPLILVGPWGWNYADVRDYYERTARHRGVLQLGFLPDADLPAVYNAARALVYPSFYEGFGLPPVEMLACGGAVIASSAAAHREVLAGHAHFIDAHDLDGWRTGLQRIILDDDWRDALRTGAVEHARHYSWRHCAQQTWATYRQVAKAA